MKDMQLKPTLFNKYKYIHYKVLIHRVKSFLICPQDDNLAGYVQPICCFCMVLKPLIQKTIRNTYWFYNSRIKQQK